MEIHTNFLFALLLLFGSVSISIAIEYNMSTYDTASFNRSNFPPDFIIGTASSAYQYEGAATEGGKGPSLWDTYTHKYPEKIRGGSNGDVAVDSYHRYKEDVALVKEMNMDAYRFSISWPRILPKGKLSGGINKEGIAHYNNVINELLANGIQPFVTLFHWDTPQALEDEYGGFLSPHIVNDFRDYADICFNEFGDRVKDWITLNEPWTYSMGGYSDGVLAPWRCSDWQPLNCTGGDSATEPYLIVHHQLLTHAAVVRLYKDKYQGTQKGQIGISLAANWMIPYSPAKNHQDAAQRAIDFTLGWCLDPITNGAYPQSMRSLVGSRLPEFSKEQSETLRGSFDFIGLNYYTTSYTIDTPPVESRNKSYSTDSQTKLLTSRDGVPIGPKAATDWLHVYPLGIWELLIYTQKYNNPLIYITENGLDEVNNPTLPMEQALVDNMRIDYYYRHLFYLQKAITDGVRLKGYFAWTLLDNFEWTSGFTVRSGIHYIDYNNGLKRHPKHSARWLKNFLKT